MILAAVVSASLAIGYIRKLSVNVSDLVIFGEIVWGNDIE